MRRNRVFLMLGMEMSICGDNTSTNERQTAQHEWGDLEDSPNGGKQSQGARCKMEEMVQYTETMERVETEDVPIPVSAEYTDRI